MRFTRRLLIILSIVALFSTLVFASDTISDPEQIPSGEFSTWAVDQDLAAIHKLAEDISDYSKETSGDRGVPATTYSTDDIYNFLYSAMRGSSGSSSYSLPRIASNTAGMNTSLSSINTSTLSIATALTSTSGGSLYSLVNNISGILSGTATGNNAIDGIIETLTFSAGSTIYSEAQLTGMIWSYVQDIYGNTNTSNGYLSSINSGITSVKSSIDDLLNISWSDSQATYLGTSSSLGVSYLSSSTNGSEFYFDFTIPFNTDGSNITRILLPLRFSDQNYITSDGIQLTQIYLSSNGQYVNLTTPEYYIETSANGTYLYLMNFGRYSGTYSFCVSGSHTLRFIGTFGHSVFYIPFDNLHYQLIKTAFESQRTNDKLDNVIYNTGKLFDIDQDIQGLQTPLSDLANYFVSPDKQAAESASQQVIDETLDDFTGSGSAAAKVSDAAAMKNISGSVQSGLDTGASVSNATSVFNTGSNFWSWFTQTTSNNINSPYPSPVVEQTRGSGDEIVDFLSGNQAELQDLLGGDQR